MTFEKIEPDTRHPALKAAEVIRTLHLETIALIDKGHVFMKDGVECNDEMRAKCNEQIAMCDKVIEYAKTADKEAWKPQGFLLEQAEETAGLKKAELDAATLPEIGNFDHEKEN